MARDLPRQVKTHAQLGDLRRCALVLVLTLVGSATASIVLTLPAGALARDFSPVATFNGIACGSTSQCIAVGDVVSGTSSGAAAALDPATGDLSTGQTPQLIGSSGLLNAVSCPSGSLCLAVGENADETEGIAVPLDPSTGAVSNGQGVRTISGIFMSGVACASATVCLAVGHDADGSGVAVALNPTTGAILSGQGVQTIAGTGGVGLEGVACPSTTLCLAVGEDSTRSAGVAVPLDPATGAILGGESAREDTHRGILSGVACPSTTLCLAVGWGASEPSVAVPIDPSTGAVSSGQSDQPISARAEMLIAVSCPSSALCLAVGNDTADPSSGQAVPIDPATATVLTGQGIQTLAGTGVFNAVVCSSSAQCVAAGSSFESAGAITEILDPATATAPGTATTPPGIGSTPPTSTVMSGGATTSSTASPSSNGQALASTGVDILRTLALGIALTLAGASVSTLAVRSRKRSSMRHPRREAQG